MGCSHIGVELIGKHKSVYHRMNSLKESIGQCYDIQLQTKKTVNIVASCTFVVCFQERTRTRHKDMQEECITERENKQRELIVHVYCIPKLNNIVSKQAVKELYLLSFLSFLFAFSSQSTAKFDN